MTDHDVLYDAVHLSPSWYVAANTLCTYNYIPGTPGHPGTLDRLTGKVGKAFTEHPSMRQDMEGAGGIGNHNGWIPEIIPGKPGYLE